MEFDWKEGFEIKVRVDEDAVVIEGNEAGLLSLASHLTTLAKESPGSHFHLDEYNSLEEDSTELIVVKTE